MTLSVKIFFPHNDQKEIGHWSMINDHWCCPYVGRIWWQSVQGLLHSGAICEKVAIFGPNLSMAVTTKGPSDSGKNLHSMVTFRFLYVEIISVKSVISSVPPLIRQPFDFYRQTLLTMEFSYCWTYELMNYWSYCLESTAPIEWCRAIKACRTNVKTSTYVGCLRSGMSTWTAALHSSAKKPCIVYSCAKGMGW